MQKIKKNLKDILLYLMNKGCFSYLSDKTYLKWRYKLIMGKPLKIENPTTYNEKLQWLKLYDRNPLYTKLVDKYEVREYIEKKIGKEYLIPLIGLYDAFEDIDFKKLPNQFVIKCTHDSGSVVICKNKKEFNLKKAKRKIKKAMRRNYFCLGREWPYKNVKPKIIIEKYMEDKVDKELIDYKVYAFNGKAEYVMACFDRFNGGTKFFYFDKEWNIQKDLSKDGIIYGDKIKLRKPVNLNKMFEFASILSKDIPFVRVDFYEVEGKLYFGELTFFPSSGFDNTREKKTELIFSDRIGDINEINRICNK